MKVIIWRDIEKKYAFKTFCRNLVIKFYRKRFLHQNKLCKHARTQMNPTFRADWKAITGARGENGVKCGNGTSRKRLVCAREILRSRRWFMHLVPSICVTISWCDSPSYKPVIKRQLESRWLRKLKWMDYRINFGRSARRSLFPNALCQGNRAGVDIVYCISCNSFR